MPLSLPWWDTLLPYMYTPPSPRVHLPASPLLPYMPCSRRDNGDQALRGGVTELSVSEEASYRVTVRDSY